MAARKINPGLKAALDYGPLLAFFLGYMLLKNHSVTFHGTQYKGFIVVTAAFIPVMLLSTGLLWWLTGHLSRMQAVTMVLVVVFGGLSVWTNDGAFFKMKPTIIYLLFGAVLGFGLLRGKSYLRLVMEEVVPLQHEGWMVLTRRVCAFFFGLAVLNEVVWRSMSTGAWVTFKTFGLTAAIFAFFLLQGRVFSDYAVEEDGNDAGQDAA